MIIEWRGPSIRRFRAICIFSVSLYLGLNAIAAAQPVEPDKKVKPAKPVKQKFVPQITISKEITWATEPVGASGFIDYLAVINRHYSQNVTPENNAVVLLYHALGPSPGEESRQPDKFFRLLGIEPLPDQGPYFEELTKWWKRTGRKMPKDEFAAILKMDDSTRSGPWTAKEYPEIAEWLQEMSVPLGRVTDATERTEYFSPLVSPNGEEGELVAVLLPAVQKARSLARALLTRSMLHLGANDSSKSWSDLMTLHRLGRLTARGPTIIEGLVGLAIENMAIEAEVRFFAETKPTAKFIDRYRKQLEHLPAMCSMADKVDFCERAMFLDCCLQIARGQMKVADLGLGNANGGWFDKVIEGAVIQKVDWNEVMKSGNRWYDRMVSAARLPKYRDKQNAFQKLDEELKKLQKPPEFFGTLAMLSEKTGATQLASNALVSMLLPATHHSLRAESRTIQRFRNLGIAIALLEWRNDHDSYPKSLDELAPKYLDAIPNDLFNDQPLFYEQTADGYRLYSVGENGVDNQGRTFGDMPGGDDLIVQMPQPKRVD